MPTALPRLLTPEVLAMIERGVSCIVASRDAALQPSLMRAVGATVDAQSERVTAWLARSQSRQLLQDLAATGHVAVVFSEPSSHLTVQLKARRVELRPAGTHDLPLLQRYLLAMQAEIGRIGFAAPFVGAMLAFELEDLVAVTFQPEQAFDQTPGPRAGSALAAPAP